MEYTTEEIKKFILENIEDFPLEVSKRVVEKFGISRQAVHIYLKGLEEEGLIWSEGTTRNKQYFLKDIIDKKWRLPLQPRFHEDKIWRELIEPLIFELKLKPNIAYICNYGFTEMVNNVLDHSEGNICTVEFKANAKTIKMRVSDDGIGIFEKIKQAYHLEDYRHAILELAKGKVTVDPKNHSGEGIFFTTRMFDYFSILSGKLYYSRKDGDGDEWLIEDKEDSTLKGTFICMKIDRESSRVAKDVFDQFASEAYEHGFTRTHVPVKLAIYGHENLVSRSQAKRLLVRFDRFKEVLLDFEGVERIGQAFADEIFRVYKLSHPEINIISIRTNEEIKNMISRAQAGT